MENKLKNMLQSGKKAVGTMCHLGGLTAAECLGIAGLDFVVIDTEHAPIDVESVRGIVLACERRGLSPVVRINRLTKDFILSVLDVGACGLIAPGIRTVEEARQLVALAKYPPKGMRGVCLTRTSAFGYDENMGSFDEYLKESNRSVLLLPQCETEECLECIEQVVAVDGVDGIFIGPYDLSVALGIPAQFEHPQFIAALVRIKNACKKAGKLLTVFCGDAARSRDYLREGYDAVVYGSDVSVLIEAYQGLLKTIRQEEPAGTSPQPEERPQAQEKPAVDAGRDIFAEYMTAVEKQYGRRGR